MLDPTSCHAIDFSTTTTLELLERRSRLLRSIREFFYERSFIEVETPVLSQETVIDLYLEPIRVPMSDHDGPQANTAGAWSQSSLSQPPKGWDVRFLQTSPEFGMKRLLASGARSIFQITRAFRFGECGQLHNPEFTMLEWYRCGDDYLAGRELLAQFVEHLTQKQCQQISYRDLMLQRANLDPFFAPDDTIFARAYERGLVESAPQPISLEALALRRRDALNFLWSELVEPNLGQEAPLLVFDWPAAEAALSQTAVRTLPSGETYEVAQRFELYFDGIELANGYFELRDAETLRKRNQQTNAARVVVGKEPLPENHRLLAAMEYGFPDCCGVALGIDRLAMVLFKQTEIQQVLTFPWSRA